jgi:GNAT superfamily N-acetyltransferase
MLHRDARRTAKARDVKISVAAEPFESADGRRLVAALDADLATRYSPDQMYGMNLKPEQLAPGLGTFVIARVGGQAAGCGALRMLDDSTAELKRMYVEPKLRGHGIAKAVLSSLEAAAKELGANRLVLETGIHQAEAIGLYGGVGFRPIDCFGVYAGSSSSLCFEKPI